MNTNIKRALVAGGLFLLYVYSVARLMLNPIDFPNVKDFFPYILGLGIVLIIILATSVAGEVRK